MRPWRVAGMVAILTIAWLSIPTPPAGSQEVDDEADLDDEDGGLDAQQETPIVGASAGERAAWLRERIDALVRGRSALAQARVGIVVRDLRTGETLYQRDPDGAYNLASNTKLFTTAAALALLGPDFTFETTLHAEEVDRKGVIAGDLYVRGRADPSLGTADVIALADDLARAGVTRIRGGLVIDDSYFDAENSPPHFDEQPEEQASFRAPVGAISLNFNRIALEVAPTAAGHPARVIVDPPNDYVQVVGTIRTVSRGRTRIRVVSAAVGHTLELRIGGQIRTTARHRRYHRRVPDPLHYFGAALRACLIERGIAVGRRNARRGAVPPDAPVLVASRSPPLAELVRGMGKYSNNYVAEMILKTIGAESIGAARPATWADATTAVHRFLVEKVGLTPGTFRYDNGSGLFDASRFSPSQVVALLAAAHRDFRYGPDLMASLSIGGVDGTLRRRLRNSEATGRIRAKTGTLATVSTLSGYAARDGDHLLAFSVLVDDIPRGARGRRQARALQTYVAAALISYLGTE